MRSLKSMAIEDKVEDDIAAATQRREANQRAADSRPSNRASQDAQAGNGTGFRQAQHVSDRASSRQTDLADPEGSSRQSVQASQRAGPSHLTGSSQGRGSSELVNVSQGLTSRQVGPRIQSKESSQKMQTRRQGAEPTRANAAQNVEVGEQ